jgi:hypothetical protein
VTASRSRRASALVVFGALALVLSTFVTPATPVQAQTSAPTTLDGEIEIISHPTMLQAGEEWVADVRVRSDDLQEGDQIKAYVLAESQRPPHRGLLRDALAAEDPFAEELDLFRIDTWRFDIDPVSGRATVAIPATAATVNPGVYVVALALTRGTRFESPPLATTTLVRLGAMDPTATALDVSIVIPLRAEVAHRPDGTVVISAAERTRLNALAGLAARFPDIPFTYDANPETIDALASGGPADINALQNITSAISGRTIIGASYVPVDVEAMREAGLDLFVADLYDVGLRTLAEHLGPTDASTAILTPTETPDSLALRRAFDTERLLADESALQPLDEDGPAAPLLQSYLIEDSTGVQMPAISADGHLTELLGELDEEEADDADTILTAQSIVADLVAGYYDDSTSGRGTTIVVPDDWDPLEAEADELFTMLSSTSLPYFRFVDLDTLFTDVAPATTTGSGRPTTTDAGTLVRTLQPVQAPDLRAFAQQHNDVDRRLRGFTTLIPAATTAGIDLEDLRLSSADRRLDPAQRREYLGAVDRLIDEGLRAPDGGPGLEGPGRQRVTMTSRRATIPVQIENNLGADANVRIELRSDKLEFPGGWLREVTLVPGPNTVEFEVESRTSGDSLLEVTVLASDAGAGLGTLTAGTYTVRSTALSGLGLVLGGLATVVLLTWWARHVLRTRRARHARPTGDDASPATEQDDPTGSPGDVRDDRPAVDQNTPSLTRTET